MSLTWSFPSPHGEPHSRWSLSPTHGWPLEGLDPKLLMRLGPELADRLASVAASRALAPGGGEVYIHWEGEVASLREL